tara:strand:- start:4100 stop:4534 length:435 start_codon:yes stop_codon:yes gene_type:complete
MKPSYIHLRSGQVPPKLEIHPYKLIIVAEAVVPEAWRNEVAEWIYQIGSRYVIAWGQSCEKWHDSVDWANLGAFDFGVVPDEDHVMTSWHAKEPLSEAFWFAGFCAHHPEVELGETIILHISEEERSEEMLAQYHESQIIEPGD